MMVVCRKVFKIYFMVVFEIGMEFLFGLGCFVGCNCILVVGVVCVGIGFDFFDCVYLIFVIVWFIYIEIDKNKYICECYCEDCVCDMLL